MIDAARALRAQAQARLDEIAAEAESLQAVIEAVEAFIDQPGSDRAAAEDTTRTSAVPATGQGPSQPGPSPAITQPGRGRADKGTRSVGTPAPASPNGAAARDTRLIAAGPYPCPGCGREFSRPQGVGRHRPGCPGRPAQPGRSEKYLCARNCGASFLSREGLRAHEEEGACRPKPTPPPVSGREAQEVFGRQPIGPGAIPGLGQ